MIDDENLTLPTEGKRVKVQKVRNERINVEEVLAEVCYFYPRYTLEEVAKLSYRQVKLLLKVARKQQAIYMYNMTQIVAAPHTKRGQGVKDLSEHFKKLANS